jgi:hypothetical protein
MILKGDAVKIKPEWQDAGDEHHTFFAVTDEDGGRVGISSADFADWSIRPWQLVRVEMLEPLASFAEWQAAREFCTNLDERTGCDMDGMNSGYLYAGNAYINQHTSGQWYLILERDSWLTGNLDELERRLYEWGAGEGLLS